MSFNSQIVLRVLAKNRYVYEICRYYIYYIMTAADSASWFPIIYVDLEGIEKWITLQKIHAYLPGTKLSIISLVKHSLEYLFIMYSSLRNRRRPYVHQFWCFFPGPTALLEST